MFTSKPDSSPKKILFVLPNLQGGGAERTAINILSGVNAKYFDCRIMVLRHEGVHLQTAIDNHWLLKSPEEPAFLKNAQLEDPLRILFSAWQIRKVSGQFKPDIILTFMSDASIPMFLSRSRSLTGAYWVAREGNNTPRTIKETIDSKFLRAVANFMIGVSLRSCDRLLCISKGMINSFSREYGVKKTNISVIYNPVNLQASSELTPEIESNLSPVMRRSLTDERPMLLAVGRLSYQKGFDILIKAFSNTLAKENYQLTILGEGELRAEFEAMLSDLQLTDSVYLPGYHDSPKIWMAKANCFVLSSRWEGFGHVVVEAMSAGAPVISTKCLFGPEEILESGLSGKLIPAEDLPALESALMELLNRDKSEMQQRVEKAQHRAKNFSVKSIISEYENLFSSIIDQRGGV